MACNPRPTSLVLQENRFKGEEPVHREDFGYPITPTSRTRNGVVPVRLDNTLVSVDCQVSDRPIQHSKIPRDGKEIFFPKSSHANPVYEIEVTGVLEYDLVRHTFWSGEKQRANQSGTMKCDAIYTANAVGRFERPHEWLRVNGKPIRWQSDFCLYNARTPTYRVAKQIEAERSTHVYRFLIDDPGECVAIAFVPQRGWYDIEMVGSCHLNASVRSLPAGTPNVEESLNEVNEPPKPPEDLRKEELHTDEVRHMDFTARLLAIARREEATLTEIDRMDISDDNKENYRVEAKDFAANEVARLSAGRRQGDSNAKTY